MMDLIIALASLILGIVLIGLLAHVAPKLARRANRPSKLLAGSPAFFAARAAKPGDPGPAPPEPSSPSL
jgi:hypothetical protein